MLSFKRTLFTLAVSSALLAVSINAQGAATKTAATNTTTPAGSSDIAALISALPQCFQSCASEAATSSAIGCKSITDLSCLCAKPAFVNATTTCITTSDDDNCPALAKNTTAIQEATKGLGEACAALASTTNSSKTTNSSSTGEKNSTSSNTSESTEKKEGNGALASFVPTVLTVGVVIAAGMATVL